MVTTGKPCLTIVAMFWFDMMFEHFVLFVNNTFFQFSRREHSRLIHATVARIPDGSLFVTWRMDFSVQPI